MDFRFKSLMHAVHEGRLDKARRLISSFGLPPTQAKGYSLLRDSIEKGHREITKLLLQNGCAVNSKNRKPSDTPLHLVITNGDLEIVEMLLHRGVYIDFRNRNGNTPLHIAAQKGSAPIVERLLEQGAYTKSIGKDGYTPLHFAVETGSQETAKLLLKNNADVNAKTANGETSLHIASYKGHTKIVDYLLNHGAFINSTTKDGCTPLHLAVPYEEEIVSLLLDHGANVDALDKNGDTVLYQAAASGYPTIVEHILKYRPDHNIEANRKALKSAIRCFGEKFKTIVANLLRCGFGIHPDDVNDPNLLHVAAERGYFTIVEDLLKYGCDVNALYNSQYDKNSYTALHGAILNKQKDIAMLLIKYGANLNVRDETGKTSLFFAILNADLDMIDLLITNGADVIYPDLLNTAIEREHKEIVDIILQHDGDINATDERGRAPLHYAVLTMSESFGILIVNLLLSKGANVHVQTKKNSLTPLHFAAKERCTYFIETLLEHHADINSKAENDSTPLHVAAARGNEAVSEMLINKGANVEAKQKDGTTPLNIASQKNHKAVVELLLKYNADVNSKDDKGTTPLHNAANKGHLEVVEILMMFGADIDARDDLGRTATDVAAQEKHVEVVMAILDFGLDVNKYLDINIGKKNHIPLKALFNSSNGIDFYYFDRLSRDEDYDSDYGYHDCCSNGRNKSDFNYTTNYYGCEYDSDDACSNSDDSENSTYVDVIEAVMWHVSKMKNANFNVNDEEEVCIFQRELECMKSEKVGDTSITFHDILTKSASQMTVHAGNEYIVGYLRSLDLKSIFPEYANVINGCFRKAIERREMLEQANKIFCSLENVLPLPCNCVENIMSYLSNKEVKIFIDVFLSNNQ